jgi:hypothetical protein
LPVPPSPLPAAIVLDVDHSDDPTYGQQECTFYHHHYQNHCYLPLFIFAGTSHALVTASLCPGIRPPGAENAMIVVRLLSSLRRHRPHTHLLVRGDSHLAPPEVIDVIAQRRWTDFVFGLAGTPVLLRQAAPTLEEARRLHHQRVAPAHGQAPPASSRLYDECLYAARSWAQPWRVVLKADVLSAGDPPRFVVTSLDAPTPARRYEDLYGACGNGANAIKAVQGDRHRDRTAATTFLAHAMRLLLACAASALHHALRTPTLQHTGLANAQPAPVILTLLTGATQIKQYKDRMRLHLPSACPVKALRHRVTALLSVVPVPALHTSSGVSQPLTREAAPWFHGSSYATHRRHRRGRVGQVERPLGAWCVRLWVLSPPALREDVPAPVRPLKNPPQYAWPEALTTPEYAERLFLKYSG